MSQARRNPRRLLAEHNLQSYAQVLDAPLRPLQLNGERRHWYTLPELSSDEPIDLLFVDGPAGQLAPGIRYRALPLLRDFLADHAALLDDTFREHESQILARWLEPFPSWRWTTAMIPRSSLSYALCGQSRLIENLLPGAGPHV